MRAATPAMGRSELGRQTHRGLLARALTVHIAVVVAVQLTHRCCGGSARPGGLTTSVDKPDSAVWRRAWMCKTAEC